MKVTLVVVICLPALARAFRGSQQTRLVSIDPLQKRAPLGDSLVPVVGVDERLLDADQQIGDDVWTLPPTSQGNAAAVARPLKKPTLQTWTRRLITREDFMGLHKASSIGFVISSSVILATGLATNFQTMPTWMEPFDQLLCLSSIGSAVTSVPMAITHRRSQPNVRNQFLGLSMTMLFQVLLLQFYSPWAIDIVSNDEFTRPMFLGLISMQMVVIVEARRTKDELAVSKYEATRNTAISLGIPMPEQASGLAFDAVTSLLIPFLGAFLVFLADPAHTRDWFLNFASERGGVPAFYYETVFTTAQIMYGSLLVTLRDKKLVGRDVLEGFNLATFSVIAATTMATILPASSS